MAPSMVSKKLLSLQELLHIDVDAMCARHGFTPIQEGMPLEAIFMAMVDGEQITHQAYEHILKEDWAPEIRSRWTWGSPRGRVA